MEEKKYVKISLGTIICIFIIILLVLALFGMWYYYNFINNSNTIKNEIIPSSDNNEPLQEQENSNINTLKPSAVIDKLFNDSMEVESYVCNGQMGVDSEKIISFYDENCIIGDGVWSGLVTNYSASSTHINDISDYNVSNLDSYLTDKCWCEGKDGNGIGETIEINAFASCEKVDYYAKKDVTIEDVKDYLLYEYNKEHEDGGNFPTITEDNISNYYTVLDQIAIINGYAKNDTLWKNNNRVKKLKLTIDNNKEYILELEDNRNLQLFDINYKTEITKKFNLKFEILEVYNGDKYDDTCLTSIYLSGNSTIPWGGR